MLLCEHYLVLELLSVFLILLPLRLICLTDSVFPAVGTLLRLNSAAEDKAALIAYKNHFHHPENQYISFLVDYQLSIPAGKSGQAALFLHPKEGYLLKKQNFWDRFGPKLPRYYVQTMALVVLCACMMTPAFALDDMWVVAERIIKDVYGKIAGVSTVLAGLMSAVAVVGAKMSNNQHKVDQAWDWLKRIWIAWMIINGIGAFIAYVTPLFSGLATLTP